MPQAPGVDERAVAVAIAEETEVDDTALLRTTAARHWWSADHGQLPVRIASPRELIDGGEQILEVPALGLLDPSLLEEPGCPIERVDPTRPHAWVPARRPVRGGPRLVALISAIGMSIFLQNWVALGQGSRDMAVPSLISGGIDIPFGNFDVTFSWSRILIIVVTVVLMVGLSLYIRHSRMGRASRACSQDMQMARLLGIDTNRVISFTFVLGAVLAAVGGVLIAITIGKLNPFIGFIAGIKAFTAAVLGGIGSIPGAMLGGVLLGLAETFAAAFISAQYKDIVAFGLLILILLFRPSGLLGKPEVEKV